MSKLLALLVAGFVGTGAFAQTTTTKPASPTTAAGALSGSASGSTSTATSTNTNTNTSVNANVNTNTNTNSVNVYGPGSNKLARQQAANGGTGVSMMPGGDKAKSSTTTATAPRQPTTGTVSAPKRTGDKVASAAKACPPGLVKKDNGCLPPGQAKKHPHTATLGNRADDRDQRR